MDDADDGALGVSEVLDGADLAEDPALVLVVAVDEMIDLDVVHFDFVVGTIVFLDEGLEIDLEFVTDDLIAFAEVELVEALVFLRSREVLDDVVMVDLR